MQVHLHVLKSGKLADICLSVVEEKEEEEENETGCGDGGGAMNSR